MSENVLPKGAEMINMEMPHENGRRATDMVRQ